MEILHKVIDATKMRSILLVLHSDFFVSTIENESYRLSLPILRQNTSKQRST